MSWQRDSTATRTESSKRLTDPSRCHRACGALERHLEEEGSLTALALSLSLTCLLSNYLHHSFEFSFLKCKTVHCSQPALRSTPRHEEIPTLAIIAITAVVQADKALGGINSPHLSLLCRCLMSSWHLPRPLTHPRLSLHTLDWCSLCLPLHVVDAYLP